MIQLGRLWNRFADDEVLAEGCAAGVVATLCALELSDRDHALGQSVRVVRTELGELPTLTRSKHVGKIAMSGLFESPHHPRVRAIDPDRCDVALRVLAAVSVGVG